MRMTSKSEAHENMSLRGMVQRLRKVTSQNGSVVSTVDGNMMWIFSEEQGMANLKDLHCS